MSRPSNTSNLRQTDLHLFVDQLLEGVAARAQLCKLMKFQSQSRTTIRVDSTRVKMKSHAFCGQAGSGTRMSTLCTHPPRHYIEYLKNINDNQRWCSGLTALKQALPRCMFVAVCSLLKAYLDCLVEYLASEAMKVGTWHLRPLASL
jgi:hypothetical protein